MAGVHGGDSTRGAVAWSGRYLLPASLENTAGKPAPPDLAGTN